jgi:hypothetical protein
VELGRCDDDTEGYLLTLGGLETFPEGGHIVAKG